MAILKIARMGHPILRRRADPVEDPSDPAVHGLVRDMVDTMVDAQGAGLAAPQVHVPLRIVVFHIPAARAAKEAKASGEDPDPDGSMPLTVLINPEIEVLGDDRADGWEGCLSVPGMRGVVPRWTHIRYRALGLDGTPIEREAHGFHARVVQHECDHLDGFLYPQRMTDLSLLVFNEELRHGLPEGAPPG